MIRYFLIINDYGRPLTSLELKEMIKDCDGYIAGLDYIDKEVIENANNLKVISRYGSGCDRIDINIFIENDVIITNTPG
jgi:D-3-phosphoglycerate dehydrogenase